LIDNKLCNILKCFLMGPMGSTKPEFIGGWWRERAGRLRLQTKTSALTPKRFLSAFTCAVVKPRSPFRIR